MTFDEMIEKDINVTNNINEIRNCDYYHMDDKYGKCVLIDCKKPFVNMKLARIKCFLLARSRYNTANIALLHIDNCIRIHTDCICTNIPCPDVMTAYKSYPTLRPEAKTTVGENELIVWENAQKCYKIKKDEYLKNGKIIRI